MLQRLDCFLYQFPVGKSIGYNTPPLCSHSSEESSGRKNTQQCCFTFGKGDAHTNQLFDVWSKELSVSHWHYWPTGASQQHQHPGVPCHTLWRGMAVLAALQLPRAGSGSGQGAAHTNPAHTAGPCDF